MKRNIHGKSKQIDWNYCFICQKKQKSDLSSSDESLKTIAENLQQFRELGKLHLEWESIATVTNDSGESGELNLLASLRQKGAQFHHKCSSKYNKQKIQRIIGARNLQATEKQGPTVTRSSVEKQYFASFFCAICNKPDILENLHAAGSLHATRNTVKTKHNDDMTNKWKSMALKVCNESLLNLLSSGDVASNELYYHGSCNISMWNECIKIDRANSKEIENDWKKAQAFDYVVNYVIEMEALDSGTVFSVKELNNMYVENLKFYGIREQCQTTRFTQKLLAYIPNLVSQIRETDRKTVVLFDEKVNELVSDYVSCPDDFFASLRKVVHPIRTDINEQINEFLGYFDGSTQANSVPRTLLLLTSALIDGNTSNINGFSQESLTVAQLIMSHTRSPNKKSRKKQETKTVRRRHKKSQETPLVQYVGLKIYSMTRSRKLIDDLFRTGMCISYDWVLELTKILYENLRESNAKHGCFFPRILKKGLFSVWLKDNVDVNPKTNFAQMSYHGTSSSLVQFVTDEDEGLDFPHCEISNKVSCESKKLMPLPAEYLQVKNLFSGRNGKLWAPPCLNFSDLIEFPSLNNAVADELSWLKKFNTLMIPTSEDCVTLPPGWAAHHASQKRGFQHPPGINTILPLLRDKVHTLNTQGHLMSMNIKWTEILNPGQTPVDVSDQPVYALTKELQFRYPVEFSKYFPIFGQLHIEQSLLVVHGQLINGSGLLEILTQNKFSMIGLSAVVDVNNIKRARYCVQVTLSALFTKLQEAAAQSMTELSPYDWLCKLSDENEVFFFWKIVIDLEINILIYVRSIREGNFKLHVEVLRKLLKWNFIFDHYNYARWLTIHWFDLMALKINFPDVFEYLSNGYFSFQKSNREFSRMGLDQLHEQNNAIIKGCGGATDLVNKIDDSALVRWETCGPDISRLLLEFENSLERNLSGVSCTKHHEDNDAFQRRFESDVKILCKGLTINPFQQSKLTKLNNINLVVPESSIDTIKNMEIKGEEQVSNFINARLVSQKVSVCETIVKNKYDIWNTTQSNKQIQFTPTKSVLNKMRSACERRSVIAKILFDHEILNVPQSLSTDGVSLYHGSKSDIVKRFKNYSEEMIPDRKCNSAMIVEMSPIIRAKAISSSGIECFSDFAVLLYYEVMKLSSSYDRVDLVFDRYFDQSLKKGTRKDRGLGSRFSFEGDDTPIPNNMSEGFLKNSENKNELNEYLAKILIELHQGPQLFITTWKDTVICSSNLEPINQPDISITKCQSEEADQRLVRHVLHCLDNYMSYKRIVVHTIDTDVLILLISYISRLPDVPLDLDIYAYLINSKKYFNIIKIIDGLGKDICLALPFFYAFTGCDTVSSFYGKGKCKAWDAWLGSEKKDIFTTVFVQLGNKPTEITAKQIEIIEELVQILYTAPSLSLGAIRVEKFIRSSDNDLRKLPPSKEALIQHTKRSCYQAGFLWRESVENFELPDPKLWGWIIDENNDFIPLWQAIQSSIDLNEFVTTCTCKTGKCKSCKCSRAGIPCISMCGCNRMCVS